MVGIQLAFQEIVSRKEHLFGIAAKGASKKA
jgi:hypothetical protein